MLGAFGAWYFITGRPLVVLLGARKTGGRAGWGLLQYLSSEGEVDI